MTETFGKTETFGTATTTIPTSFPSLDLSDLGIEIDPSSLIDHEDDEMAELIAIKEGKRQMRMALCGSWARRLNPSNGSKFWYQMRCGYWRECPECLSERVAKFKERGHRCQQEAESLGVAQGSKKEIQSLVRKLRKVEALYWRIPTEDGDVLLYEAKNYPSSGELEYDDLRWEDVCVTPEGRKYSGKLGHVVKDTDEDKGESVIVTCPQFVFSDLDGQDAIRAWAKTMDQTDDLDPSYDEDEISWACWQRQTRFRENCEELGGVVENEVSVRLRVFKKTYKGWLKEPSKGQEGREEVPLAAPDSTQKGDFALAMEELFDF